MTKDDNYIYDKKFFDFYILLTRLPNDYDPKKPENIKIFGQRLRHIRETAKERNNQILQDEGKAIVGPTYCEIKTATDLAKALGVSVTTVKDYENGNYTSVPIKCLLDLYKIFGVTPHYFLGLTSGPDKVLSLDEQGAKRYKDGKLVELIVPDTPSVSFQQQAHHAIADLLCQDPEKSQIICRLLTAKKIVRDTGLNMLKAYLDGIESV